MEDQEEKAERMGRKAKGLVYIIVMVFGILAITAFFLYCSMEEVKTLKSHKNVLIDRLAEEVLAKRKLQKERDSLKRYQAPQGPLPVADDMQAMP